jgi:hypothetical protein
MINVHHMHIWKGHNEVHLKIFVRKILKDRGAVGGIKKSKMGWIYQSILYDV